jgi:hypothetical protein
MSEQHRIPDDPEPHGPYLPAAALVFVLTGGRPVAELVSTRHDGTQRRMAQPMHAAGRL